MAVRHLCVFCGSSPGSSPVFARAAGELGGLAAARGLELVYGGGKAGLMGTLADAALKAGGRVTGVIPRALVDRELAHPALTRLHVVGGMHQRKALLASLADAFAVLPGGLGTFDELFEAAAWSQLGLHAKPIGLLNVDGYFDPLLAMLDRGVEAGFVQPRGRAALLVRDSPQALLDCLADGRTGTEA